MSDLVECPVSDLVECPECGAPRGTVCVLPRGEKMHVDRAALLLARHSPDNDLREACVKHLEAKGFTV